VVLLPGRAGSPGLAPERWVQGLPWSLMAFIQNKILIMRKFRIHVLALISMLLLASGFTGHAQPLDTKVHFATVEKAQDLLTTRDEYTDRWSKFDVYSRLGRRGYPGELLKFIREQVRDWSEEEKGRITHIIKSITVNIHKKGFNLQFPDTVFMIKTNAKEESGAAGYTRANYIVLKDNIMNIPYNRLRKTVTHELFHVLSRNDSMLRRELYSTIGFTVCNEVKYPPELAAFRMSNPDAPKNDAFIHLKAGEENVECMMILYADRPYRDGSFFDYLNIGFLRVSGEDHNKQIVYEGDKAVVYKPDEVSGFFEQIGNNTNYIIHPEEILAENFVFALQGIQGLPSPEIIEKISEKMRE
jgi:hypothetical protein